MGRYSKSFTLLETFLFIIIGAIIAGTVLFVYNSNKSTSENLKKVGANNEINVKKPTAQAETAAPALQFVQ